MREGTPQKLEPMLPSERKIVHLVLAESRGRAHRIRRRRARAARCHLPPLSDSSTDTIAAIATPPGKGAIAIVRVSGPAVPELAQRYVRTTSRLRARAATPATVLDERGDVLDHALAILFPAPHSYTGEAMLELQLHGSPVVAREVVRALLAGGARLAQPGEFTRRAFLNAKMDLHAASAVADVIDAETRAAARAALANLGGGLADEVRALRERLWRSWSRNSPARSTFPTRFRSPIGARSNGESRRSPPRSNALRRDGELGRIVREGVHVAIVGPPNAGKSSLLNALLGMERAIVSEIPGTTRDTIEETIVVDGVPVRLVDTAGIRAHADRLEAAGIERARKALAGGAIALVVVDGSLPLGADARSVLEATREHDRILFFNKSDLGTRGADEAAGAGAIVGSVRREETLVELRRAIAGGGMERRAPRPVAPAPGRPARVRSRQRRPRRARRRERVATPRRPHRRRRHRAAACIFGARACKRAGRRRRDRRRNLRSLLHRKIRRFGMPRALRTLAALAILVLPVAAQARNGSRFGVTIVCCVVNSNGNNTTNGINVVLLQHERLTGHRGRFPRELRRPQVHAARQGHVYARLADQPQPHQRPDGRDLERPDSRKLAKSTRVYLENGRSYLMKSSAVHVLTRNWWMVLIRGIAAVVFGILACCWPGATIVGDRDPLRRLRVGRRHLRDPHDVPRGRNASALVAILLEGIVGIVDRGDHVVRRSDYAAGALS